MNKINWNKILPHVIVLAIMLLFSIIYFYPAFENSLKTHDIKMFQGMSKEIKDFRAETGVDPLWTGSMFGGMPADQIAITKDSNLMKYAYKIITFGLPRPIESLWLLFLGFYILLQCLKVDPWIALIGAIGFGLSTNFLIGLQAGHMTKIKTTAFMPAVLGGFIYTFRGNALKGGAIFTFFFSMQWWSGHPQITYYTMIVLGIVGVYFVVDYLLTKKAGELGKRIVILGLGTVLALLTSLPGLWGTYEYSKHTIRGKNHLTIKSPGELAKDSTMAKTDGLDNDYILAWSYGTGETFTFIFPSLKGGGNNDPKLKNLETLFPSRAEKLTEQMKSDLSTLQVDELFAQGGLNLATIPATQERGYYGQQGLTNGPVFIGVILCLMSLLSLVFSDGKLNWVLFGATLLTILLAFLQLAIPVFLMFIVLIVLAAINRRFIWFITIVTLLTVMLAWGKNFLGFSEIFIKYFPMYGKFRAVTMILAIADMLIPLMGILFLVKLIEKKDEIKENLMKLYIGTGVVAFATLIVWVNPEAIFSVPNGLSGTGAMYQNYLMQTVENNPDLKAQFSSQVSQYFADYSENLKDFRVGLIKDDALKAIGFILAVFILIFIYLKEDLNVTSKIISFTLLFAATLMIFGKFGFLVEGVVLISFFARRKMDKFTLLLSLGILLLVDLIPTDLKYLNNKKDEAGEFNYWQPTEEQQNPFNVFDGDNQIYEMEVAQNPMIAEAVKKKLTELNASSDVPLDNKSRQIAKFSVLNSMTNFRVANFQGLTSESRTSYFYKSLGGYHGAKLRRIQDVFDFFNELDVEQIVNMMNVKYQVQYDYNDQNEMSGMKVAPNPNALGAAWIVNKVSLVDNADDELMGMKKGSGFNAGETAIVNKEFSDLITSPEGKATDAKIVNTSYAPNELEYEFSSSQDETVIFSEIYYPYGWKAYIDDQPVEYFRANYVLRGLTVPKGEHRISFKYSVPAYTIGNTVALISSSIVVLLLLAMIYLSFKKHALMNEPETEALDL